MKYFKGLDSGNNITFVILNEERFSSGLLKKAIRMLLKDAVEVSEEEYLRLNKRSVKAL